VGHPVTEGITGRDLVELMIRVAAGEALPFTQAQIRRDGWAMECRINAEDPFRNFLPSTGRLVKYLPPPEQDGVRVDTGVYEGGEIPMYYDSMIAKLIVHGASRDEAIAKMRQALNAFAIRGISSNIPFQAALLAHPKFMAGDFNTGFIAEQFPTGFSAAAVPHGDPLFLRVLAAVANREPFCAQIERAGLAYRVSHNGTQIEAKVFTPRAAELSALMPFKAPPDLSRFLLSPMPGLLVDVAVQPGQTVRAGEKLAVIEA